MRISSSLFILVVSAGIFFASGLEGSKASTNAAVYTLPAIDFGDILMQSESASVDVMTALVTIGALQVTGIPNFEQSRYLALSDLAHCLSTDKGAAQITMQDGSRRVTSAAQSVHGIPQEMSSSCGAPSSALRTVVDTTVSQLFRLLDKAVALRKAVDEGTEELLSPYTTFESIGRNGEHLEHLHAYYSPTENSGGPALDMHIDAGLLIAMTTGLYTSVSEDPINSRNGLYMELPSGLVVEVGAEDDAIVVMVGQGGATWLQPVLGADLRPVPHALIPAWGAGTDEFFSRSWYGKMYLPPSDAKIGTATYEEYRNQELQGGNLDYIPSVCDSITISTTHGLGYEVVQNTLCDGGTGVYCWKQCMPVDGLSCGLQAECVDTVTGEPVDGVVDCPSSGGMEACELQCLGSGGGNSTGSSSSFCTGPGTAMYMDGFASTVQEDSADILCINLLFTDWTLDSRWKFAIGCLGVFMLGMLVEYITKMRRDLAKRVQWSWWRDALMVLLHAAQVCMGYFLMLCAMTYNVEIFCMVLCGIAAGYALFNLASPPKTKVDYCCAGTDEPSNEEYKLLH